MANIKQFLDGISASKELIRSKALDMGVQPPEGYEPLTTESNLATVAAAIGNIQVQHEDIAYNVSKSSNGASLGGGQFYAGTITLGFEEDEQYYNTPVYADSEETTTYEADDDKLITKFSVRPVPTVDLETISASEIISDGNTDKYTRIFAPVEGTVDKYGNAVKHYLKSLEIQKVMLGEYEFTTSSIYTFDDLYDANREDDIVIDKTAIAKAKDQSFDWSGVDKVTIPKPSPSYRNKTVDIYNDELQLDESNEVKDFEFTVDSGMIYESEFKVEVLDLYNALAAI